MDLERDVADSLGTEASIIYARGFSTIPCMISVFEKRWDIIVADRGINFAIQKDLLYLADRPHPPAFSGAIVGCCCRISWTRYSRRACGSCCASSPWVGSPRSVVEHPTRCYGCARTRGRRHKGAVVKMLAKSTLASSRAVPIIFVCVRLSYSSPYRIPASWIIPITINI